MVSKKIVSIKKSNGLSTLEKVKVDVVDRREALNNYAQKTNETRQVVAMVGSVCCQPPHTQEETSRLGSSGSGSSVAAMEMADTLTMRRGPSCGSSAGDGGSDGVCSCGAGRLCNSDGSPSTPAKLPGTSPSTSCRVLTVTLLPAPGEDARLCGVPPASIVVLPELLRRLFLVLLLPTAVELAAVPSVCPLAERR